MGFAFFAYVAWSAIAGPDLVINPVFGVVFVWLWVGVVFASLLVGPFYRAVNPVRTLHLAVARATGRDPGRGTFALPEGVGMWPAAVGLFAFVWLELVYPRATFLAPLLLWFAMYFAVTLVGAALFGNRCSRSQTPSQLSDPMGTGTNLLGTGHVLGVIASHDRAIKLLPKRHQLSGQLPLLLVMVFYTATGLYLLFGA